MDKKMSKLETLAMNLLLNDTASINDFLDEVEVSGTDEQRIVAIATRNGILDQRLIGCVFEGYNMEYQIEYLANDIID
jgi:hypothetical protein